MHPEIVMTDGNRNASERISTISHTMPQAEATNDAQLKVDGIDKLVTSTAALDDFWKFVALRQDILRKRLQGDAPPWTDDPLLARYAYCNVYRVADRGCQFLIGQVIESGSQEPQDIVLRVLLYNMFSWPATYLLLEEELGPLKWSTFDVAKCASLLSDARRRGVKVYTGALHFFQRRMSPLICTLFQAAYQRPNPKLGGSEACVDHIDLVAAFMDSGLVRVLQTSRSAAEVFSFLHSFQSMGKFLAFQLLIDLSYTPLLNFHPSDFVVPGPGSTRGLQRCFRIAGVHPAPKYLERLMQWLAATQSHHFSRLGLHFSGLGDKALPLSAIDIEHSMCEFDKYKTGLKRQNHRFKPQPLEALVLPRAWSHPARLIPQPCTKPPTPEKRYVVERIVGQRGDNGDLQYLVQWQGWTEADRTWEDAVTLTTDAPNCVAEWHSERGMS